MKIKVMHLLWSSRFSGAENVVCQIIEMYKHSPNIEMLYVSPKGQIEDSLNAREIPYYGLEKNIVSVKAAIKKYKPDIIHAHDVTASLLAFLTAPRRTEIISHMHVNNNNMSKINAKTVLYYFSTIRYKKIFWVSRSALDGFVFASKLKNKNEILFNVIDRTEVINRLRQREIEKQYDVVYIGRITRQKNPKKLIDVFAELIKIRSDILIGVVGEGDLLEEIKDYAKDRNVFSRIDFTGYIENPMAILNNSKILILTSDFEGTPMVVLEAMALGKPVVSTPTDGIIDLIQHGENGYLETSVTALAERISELLDDDEKMNSFSNSTTIKFDKMMDVDKYKKQLDKEYY